MSKRFTEVILLQGYTHVFTGTTRDLDSVRKNVQLNVTDRNGTMKPRDEYSPAVRACLLQE